MLALQKSRGFQAYLNHRIFCLWALFRYCSKNHNNISRNELHKRPIKLISYQLLSKKPQKNRPSPSNQSCPESTLQTSTAIKYNQKFKNLSVRLIHVGRDNQFCLGFFIHIFTKKMTMNTLLKENNKHRIKNNVALANQKDGRVEPHFPFVYHPLFEALVNLAGRRRGGRGAAEGAGAFPSCPPQAGPSSSSGPETRSAPGAGAGEGPGPRSPPPPAPAITATAAPWLRGGGEGARPGPARWAPPLPSRYHCAGPGPAPSALLSSPPPSRLYPRTIDPAFLPHIRGLYAEPAEASRLPTPGADRARPAALVTCLGAGLATLPAGLGGPPPRHGRPQPVPPAPPGARTHGHTAHTHTRTLLATAEGGRRGGDERAGPALHSGRGGRAPALPGAGRGRAGQRRTHGGREGGRGAHGG